MKSSADQLTCEELGLWLGILMGIAALQGTGELFALLALTVIGSGLGLLVGRINHSRSSWAEEE